MPRSLVKVSKVSVTSVGSTSGTQLTRDTKLSTTRQRSWRLIVTALTPILGLIIQNSVMMSSDVDKVTSLSTLSEFLKFSLGLGEILHMNQRERGATVLFLNSRKGGDNMAELSSRHSDTDKAYATFNAYKYSGNLAAKLKTINDIYDDLEKFRTKMWAGKETPKSVLAYFEDINTQVISIIVETVEKVTDANLWKIVVAYSMLVQGKENMGVVRASGITVLNLGSVPIGSYAYFCFNYANGLRFLAKSTQFSATISEALVQEFEGSELDVSLSGLRKKILYNNGTGSFVDGQKWFDNMTSYIDILRDIELSTGSHILSQLDTISSDAESRLIISISLVCLSLLLVLIVYIFVTRMTSTIRVYANSLKEKTLDLKREKKKIEKVLQEILPVSIAEKLLRKEIIEPEHYSSASIYFSDIVGFTNISSNSTPMQVVDMLNDIYNSCDTTLEKYDVYKVETIGDAYMVVSGVPDRNGNLHSAEIALMSLDILDIVSHMTITHMPDVKLKIRIGLNTGPVVAGVVGSTMPRYCLFGETVITAQTMESTGLPNKVHVAARTQRALEDHGGFHLVEREETEVKGKTIVGTYFLTGKDSKMHPDR